MMKIKIRMAAICLLSAAARVKGQDTINKVYKEQYRPQIHFSPKEHWMNDPNGMVYLKGKYHLFYQYYPHGTVWGPMHWGHAVSKDLAHWKELPIALYPDSLGYIFSGSVVIDSNNTSGFSKNGKIPMVAIFTHHDPKGEKAGNNNFQNQSLAYSLDEGQTWTKYSGNPVLNNPGIRDFRDPKVMWYPQQKKWIMTLATLDHITFFSSPNLKNWTIESEFGKGAGAHGGVWECPDLFPLKLDGKTYWVLLVNLNPGGPNGGSATQYFTGFFDGKIFKPLQPASHWLDYGPDEYAGVTWSNTGDRNIFLGWMSNWQYANQVPTVAWRNAMTIPRELALKKTNGQLLVTSNPVKELSMLAVKTTIFNATTIKVPTRFILQFKINQTNAYSVILSNAAGGQLIVGFDAVTNRYFIDRTHPGNTKFNTEFSKVTYAPRISNKKDSDIKLVVDASSIEVFADSGLSVMTSTFFPETPFNHVQIERNPKTQIHNFKLVSLKSIWNSQ